MAAYRDKLAQQKNANDAYTPTFSLRMRLDTASMKTQVLRIEIENNGPTLDPVTQRKLFDPFYTTKPVDQGTGLGLSVSYFIIKDEHNGRIWVESPASGGVRFVILLPLSAS